jgi:imidazolonepropionase-like amidohydrolase
MRRLLLAVVLASVSPAIAQVPSPARPPQPTFRLFFLGHEIGGETDVWPSGARAPHLQSTFHFVDRGTPIDLSASLDLSTDRSPTHLLIKGKNYRLFASDSEVTIAGGRAHVRDLTQERDIDLGGKPFFPIDNYAPIGVQEELIKYWVARGRPAEMASAPSGPIRITSRGAESVVPLPELAPGEFRIDSYSQRLERLAIDGVVWGRETAWIDPINENRLIAVTTWAGALPFEAVRTDFGNLKDRFIGEAVADRIADLKQLTASLKPQQSATFALVGGTVVDGTSHAPTANATVLVRDGRIAAVGPAASVQIPRGTPTVDAKGSTIIAGLWDMHAHAGQVDWAPAYLAGGVTTIRDMGGEEPVLIAIRDAIAAGALGPRYLLAGLIDGPGPRAFGMVNASTPEEAVAIVRRYHDEHFNEIKIYIETPAALVPVITAEAHRLGMTVTGHLPAGLTWQTAVEQGYDGIAHMQLRGTSGSDQSKQQIAFFKEHHTVMDPTESWNELSSHSMAQPLDNLLPGAARLPLPLKRMFDSMAGGNGGQQTNSLKLLKDAIDAGILVVAGTDKGVPGLSLQREIELYVDGGMTPLEAIQAATIMPARAMKLDNELGTIEVGKRADMVILSANPLDHIENIRSATMVVTAGRLYDCAKLWAAAGFAPR